jgi:hypothetical protein
MMGARAASSSDRGSGLGARVTQTHTVAGNIVTAAAASSLRPIHGMTAAPSRPQTVQAATGSEPGQSLGRA